MKVSLVVASGAHEGRVIPLTGSQFLIGRDQQCNLRPASPAISKLHCGVVIRDGKVLVKDFGSTNGTLVNGQLVQSAEAVVENGASLQVGPLDFTVRIEKSAPKVDGTPLGDSPETAAALAAVKAATAAPKAPARDATPAPVKPTVGKSGVTAPTKPAPAKEQPKPAPAAASGSDEDDVAAMLLGMDDEGNGSVPDGSTVMEIPNPLTAGGAEPPKSNSGEKPGEPKKAQTREEMTNAANDLLRQYMRRPK
ncbi:FHA domain-containing protein [Gemmata sp. JC673]|uniref:FHA domain-containing protein n=1 Tax=Gemmata algarum TaxID=2975278 RepID=A0ABU5F0X7_9BACT|nr:FHA domain-containing protein [Gemmata algarum]MDY3559514.1 FHA domain-containing protein [Gemmata algarum]